MAESKIKSGIQIRKGRVEFSSDVGGTVTFSSPMPDANYVVTMITEGGNRSYAFAFSMSNKTTNGFDFMAVNVGSGAQATRPAWYLAIG